MKRPEDLLIAVRDESVSPETAALLIAKEARPELDVAHELSRIDALAAELGPQDAKAPPARQAKFLSTFLFERLGFRGNEDDYLDPRNSYLDEVLTRRTGIPITLAVLLAAVGRRVGIVVDGIGFPAHFLARVGGEGGVYVDPFFGGRVLPADAIERLAEHTLGSAARLRPEHLAPASLRALVVRMLLNLKHAHERLGDRARALVVCDRLFDLSGTIAFRRDRGLHALELGAYAAAASDLRAYLEASPGAPDVSAVRLALARAERPKSALS
ncbi:MAG: tetratricopeptide repeat protein [Sandaracinaceae bacterium]|nr:tetratricopeptide repeat protein [Sandaracinaceae bacterium]